MADMEKAGFIEGLRKVMVETLVPEIRELRAEMASTRVEIKKEMDERFARSDARLEAFQKDANTRFEAVLREIRTVAERQAAADGKLDLVLHRLDVADRVAKLEGEVAVLLRKIPA